MHPMPNDSYYRSNETAEALDGRRFTGEKRNKTAPTCDVVFPFQTNAEQRGRRQQVERGRKFQLVMHGAKKGSKVRNRMRLHAKPYSAKVQRKEGREA